MGKDSDMSKEELAQENERLVEEVGRLQKGLEELQARLEQAAHAYQQSKASFSLTRYGQLKDLVKQLVSEDSMKQVQSLTENQTDGSGGGKGLVGLVQRAREFATQEGAAIKEKPDPPAPKAGKGKLSGFFKKIKQAAGLSDDPHDIRCLDKDDIRRDNERKRREIQRLTGRGRRAQGALRQLSQRYQASKKHAPPARYQVLKDMIKDIVAEQI